MKKLLKFKKLLIVALLTLTLTIGTALQSTSASPTVLPDGKNYLEESNLLFDADFFAFEYSIRVLPETTYTFSFPGTNMITNLDIIAIQGSNPEVYSDVAGFCTVADDWVTCTFTTDTSEFLTIEMEGGNFDQYHNFHGVDNFQLEVGSSRTTYEPYAAAAVDTSPPLISGGTVHVSNVNNPVSLATITASLSVYDEVDGDLTGSLIITFDNYTGNEAVVGEHTITYSVTDASGNTATVDFTVAVVDTDIPIINLNGANPHRVEYGTTYSEPGATVTDNYDSGLTAVITGTVNSLLLGTYYVYYNITDSSGNVAAQVIREVIVEDTTAPTIQVSSGTLYIEFGDNYTEGQNTVHDAFDGETAMGATVTGTVNVGVLGTYYIYYNATDSNGNVAIEVIKTVIVQDTIAPVISYTSLTFTYSETQNVTMSMILSNYSATDLFDGDMTNDFVITNDTFTGSATEIGIFNMTLTVTDTSGNVSTINIIINVIDDEPPVFITSLALVTRAYYDSMTQQDLRDYFASQE